MDRWVQEGLGGNHVLYERCQRRLCLLSRDVAKRGANSYMLQS